MAPVAHSRRETITQVHTGNAHRQIVDGQRVRGISRAGHPVVFGGLIGGIAVAARAVFSARALEVLGVPDYRLFIRGDEVEYHRRLQRSGLRFGTALDAT